MNTLATPLAGSLRFTDFIMGRVIGDIDDAVARRRVRGDDGPSIAWIVGHLLFYRHEIARALGDTTDNPYAELFGSGGASDGADYPGIEELHTRTFDGARHRSVAIDGEATELDEIVEHGGGTSNAVWRDASARILRREIAGPGLVAVPTSRALALRAVATQQSRPPSFVPEAEQRFGLWRPNSAWEACTESSPIDSVSTMTSRKVRSPSVGIVA